MDSPGFVPYPSWLGVGLLNGFDWSRAVESTMPRFLSEYTLHDSSWIGLWSEPGWESVALIGWDTHWSRGRVPYPIEGTNAGYPFLVIQFERLYRQHLGFNEENALETIANASSQLVPASEHPFQPLAGRSERVFRTVVTPVVGGDVELWHGGATRFLCLDAMGNALAIPDL